MVKKRQSKKGLELSINTIIILVIVVVALVAIAAFFFGGFGKLTDSIKNVFFGASGGYDRTLAIQNCETYCDQLQSLGDRAVDDDRFSAYCTRSFDVDTNNDGKADQRFYCHDKAAALADTNGQTLPELPFNQNRGSLQVSCTLPNIGQIPCQ